jgi:hypothetical protein
MGALVERFRVTIFPVEGAPAEYSVLTWYGTNKAVAIAVEEFILSRREDGPGGSRELSARILRVAVELVGRPDTDKDDVPIEVPGELLDRMEW